MTMSSLRSNQNINDDRGPFCVERESSERSSFNAVDQARMNSLRTHFRNLSAPNGARTRSSVKRSRWSCLMAILGASAIAMPGCNSPTPVAEQSEEEQIASLRPPELVAVKPVAVDADADYHGRVQLLPEDWRFAREQPLSFATSAALNATERESERELTWTVETDQEPSAEEPQTPKKEATGKFDGEIDLSQIDTSEDAQTEKSASDLGKVEIVPTPVARKEIEAEIVPTPLGLPENHRSTAAKTAGVAGPTAARRGNAPAADLSDSPIDLISPEKMIAKRPVNDAESSAAERLSLPAEADAAFQLTGPDSPIIDTLIDAETVGGGQEPEDYNSWPEPSLTLFVTGQQHGYIEPCGCTGLENQKGGVARRMTFLNQLREKGWDMAPIDAGNLVRRYGRQAEIKFHRSLEALREMDYVSVGLGPDDVRLSVNDLIQEASPGDSEEAIYVSANVIPFDRSLMPAHRVVRKGGMTLAVTTLLDPDSLETKLSADIQMTDLVDSAKEALASIQKENPDYTVLTFYGKEENAQELVRAVPGFDLVVIAGGYGEPTYQPQLIEGTETKAILTGDKGMYAGLVGLYPDAPIRYARVPLTHEFEDSQEMRDLMKDYQFQLRDVGFEGLGLKPIQHPSGDKFVGAEACGKCHTTAFDIWESSAHFEATEHLVNPGERGDVSRHFDPECISCHVTGWNPQGYYPYVSGYLELEASSHLHGNGCENCHGPGAAHTKAEEADSGVSDEEKTRLREAMKLPLDEARESCMKCHDLDNSPDFHADGAFNDYWAEIEHYGLD
ncbi:multiheme c-type cytochrome [Rhodopirellula bahusiensis]|uniref:Cytochrome C554 n=2 Tax=Rhodopirellula bahusiensis TaxID=2014065 RepID=A0A2G1W508_9BACT|nr:cytochrome C554 [Rhodopirellula bahusiensis]